MTLRDALITESIQNLLLDDLVNFAVQCQAEMSDKPVSESQHKEIQEPKVPYPVRCHDNFRSRSAYLNLENILVWGTNLTTESSTSSERYSACAETLKAKLGLTNHHAVRTLLVYPSPFEIQVSMPEFELRYRILSEVQFVHLSESDPSKDLLNLSKPVQDPLPVDPSTTSDLIGLCQEPLQQFISSFEKFPYLNEDNIMEEFTIQIVALGLCFLQTTAIYRDIILKVESMPTGSSIHPLMQMHLKFLVLERMLIASLSAKFARVRAQNLPLREFITESSMLIKDYKMHQKHIHEKLINLVGIRQQKDGLVVSDHLSISQTGRRKPNGKQQKFGITGHPLSLSEFSRRTDGPLEVIQESKVSEVSEASKEPKSIRWNSFDETLQDSNTIQIPKRAVSGPDEEDDQHHIVILPQKEEIPQEMSHDDLDLADEVHFSHPTALSSIKKNPYNSSSSQSFKPTQKFIAEEFCQQTDIKQPELLEPLNAKKQDSMILSEDTEFSKDEHKEVSNSLYKLKGVPKSPHIYPSMHHSTNSHLIQAPLNSTNSNQSNSKTNLSNNTNLTAQYEAAAINSKHVQPSAPNDSGQVQSLVNTQNNQFTLRAQPHNTVLQSPLRKPADVFDSAISESQEHHLLQNQVQESRVIYEVPKLSRLQPLSDLGNDHIDYDPLSSGREAPRSVFIPTENKNVPIMYNKMPRENSTKNLNLSASGPLHGLQSMAFSESLTQMVRGRDESAPTPAFMSGAIHPKPSHDHPLQGITEQSGARINLNQSQFADIPYSPVAKVTSPQFNSMGQHPEDLTESQVFRRPNIPRADRKHPHTNSSSIRNEEKSGQLDASAIVGGWGQSTNNQQEAHSIRTMTTLTNNRHYMTIGTSSISRPAVHLDVDLSTYNSEYGNNLVGDDRTSATGLTGRGFFPIENPFGHYEDSAPSKTNVIENLGDKALVLKALDTSSVFNPSCINGNFPSGMKPNPYTASKTRGGNDSNCNYIQDHSAEKAKNQNHPGKSRADLQKRADEPMTGSLAISTVQLPRTIGSSLIPSESSLMITRDKCHHRNRSETVAMEDHRNKQASTIGSDYVEGFDNLKFTMSVQNQKQSFNPRMGLADHRTSAEEYELATKGQQQDEWGVPWDKLNTVGDPNARNSGKHSRQKVRTNFSIAETSSVDAQEKSASISKQKWRASGFYIHFGKLVAMNFSQLKCELGGAIQGQGVDTNGVFGISGTVKHDREVQFTKQYLGMQPIAFKGAIDHNGSKVEGLWEFGGMQGNFLIECSNIFSDHPIHQEGSRVATNAQSSNTNSGFTQIPGIGPRFSKPVVGMHQEQHISQLNLHGSAINQKNLADHHSQRQVDESGNTYKKKSILEISKSLNYADNSMRSPNESGQMNSIFRSSVDHNKETINIVSTKKADSVFYQRDEEDLTSLPSPKFNGKRVGLLSGNHNHHISDFQSSAVANPNMPKLKIPLKTDMDILHDVNYPIVNNISKRVGDTVRVELGEQGLGTQSNSLNTNQASDMQDPPISKRCQSSSVDPNILSIMKHKESLPNRGPPRIVGLDANNYSSSYAAQDPNTDQETTFDYLHTASHVGQVPRHHMYPPIPREADYGSGKSANQMKFLGAQHSSEIKSSFAYQSGLSSSQLKPLHYHSFGPVYESGVTLGRKRGGDSRKILEESGVSVRVAHAINRLVTKLSASQPKNDTYFVQKDIQRIRKLHKDPKTDAAELFTSMNDEIAMNHHSALDEDAPGNEDVKLLTEALAVLIKESEIHKTPKQELDFNSMVSGDRDQVLPASPLTAKLELELAVVREEASSYKRALEDLSKNTEKQETKLEMYKDTLLKSQKETESKILQMMKDYQTQMEQLKSTIHLQDSINNIGRHVQTQTNGIDLRSEISNPPVSTITAADQMRLSATHFFKSKLEQSQPQDLLMQQHPMMRRSMDGGGASGIHQPIVSSIPTEYFASYHGAHRSRQRATVGARSLLDYYKEELNRKTVEIKKCELILKEEKKKAEKLAAELAHNNRELSEKKSEVSELEKKCENLSKKNMVLNMSCERLRFTESILAKDFDCIKQKYYRRSHVSSPTVNKQLHKRGGSYDHFNDYYNKDDHHNNRLSHSSRRFSNGTEEGNTEDSHLKSGARPLPLAFLKLLANQKQNLIGNSLNLKSPIKMLPANKKCNSLSKNAFSKEKLKREVCLNYGDPIIFPFTKETAPNNSFVKELKKGQSLALMKKYGIDSGIRSFSKKAQRCRKAPE